MRQSKLTDEVCTNKPSRLVVGTGEGMGLHRDVYGRYFVRFHDNPEPSQVMLAEEFSTSDADCVPGSWCLQSHVREGIFRDVDMSREDDFQES